MQIVLNCHKNNRLNFCYAIYNFRVFFVCFFLLFSVMISHLYANANASPAQTRLHLFDQLRSRTFSSYSRVFTWRNTENILWNWYLRSPLKDIVVGKIRSEWKKIQDGRKKYFSNVLRSLAKLLRSLEKLCVLSQNFCVLSQRYLRSLAKLILKKYLREKAKFCEGTQISLRENAKVCEGTQISLRENAKVCERTQSFSRERKSFARERKTFEKYFFLPSWIFFHSPRIFPTTMSLKGLRRYWLKVISMTFPWPFKMLLTPVTFPWMDITISLIFPGFSGLWEPCWFNAWMCLHK